MPLIEHGNPAVGAARRTVQDKLPAAEERIVWRRIIVITFEKPLSPDNAGEGPASSSKKCLPSVIFHAPNPRHATR